MTIETSKDNDKELLKALQDPALQNAAFTLLVKQNSEQLYWQIRRIVLSHDDTDDILQNTFIKAWNNINNFRGDSQLSTWLHRIAINETLTFLSHKPPAYVPLDSEEVSMVEQLESDQYFNGSHADALLHEAVNRLPHKQHIIFSLKYFEEMKYEEISELLGTSIGALKASYHIAVKKIGDYIKKND